MRISDWSSDVCSSDLDHPAPVVWEAATNIDCYTSWWPWLRGFEATAFATGAVWHAVAKPPLPYRVRLVITLQDVVPCRFVRAAVAGDVRGGERKSVGWGKSV